MADEKKPARWKARLGPDGLLLGYDESGEGEGVNVPAGCDLTPGAYAFGSLSVLRRSVY